MSECMLNMYRTYYDISFQFNFCNESTTEHQADFTQPFTQTIHSGSHRDNKSTNQEQEVSALCSTDYLEISLSANPALISVGSTADPPGWHMDESQNYILHGNTEVQLAPMWPNPAPCCTMFWRTQPQSSKKETSWRAWRSSWR